MNRSKQKSLNKASLKITDQMARLKRDPQGHLFQTIQRYQASQHYQCAVLVEIPEGPGKVHRDRNNNIVRFTPEGKKWEPVYTFHVKPGNRRVLPRLKRYQLDNKVKV